MKIRNSIFLLFTGLTLFTACRSSRNTAKETGAELFKNKWTLTQLNGDPVQGGSYEIPFLEFSKGDLNRVSGNSSCNILSGTFTLKNKNGISFSQIASTRKACMGENIETQFLDMLNKVTQYQLTNDELFLLQGKDVVAIFKAGDVAAPTELPQELTGVWKLNYITGKRIAFQGLYPDDIPTLAFTAGDAANVGGNTSCNVFSSKMTLTDSTIQISAPHIMTMRACEGEGEQTFLQMLTRINRYSVNDSTLTLLANDVAMMRLEKQ